MIYTESWSPQYNNRKTVKHWFQEWNTRGKVVVWEIKQFFHKGDQTIVEWYFKNEMNNGSIEEFDGISLVEWTEDNRIKSLKEFGCNRNTYNPYQEGDTPQFKSQKANCCLLYTSTERLPGSGTLGPFPELRFCPLW